MSPEVTKTILLVEDEAIIAPGIKMSLQKTASTSWLPAATSINVLAGSRGRLDSIPKAAPTGIGVVQGDDRAIIEVNEKTCEMTR
jgi:hypothetical protein